MSDVAPVAQLDRASGFEPGGCGFKSCQGYQKNERASSSAVEQLPLKQLVEGLSGRNAKEPQADGPRRGRRIRQQSDTGGRIPGFER